MMNYSSSIIHLCQGPLPVAPQHGSSVISLISSGSLSVSQSYKRSHVALSSPLHMNYSRLHRFSKEKNNIVRGGSLAMACSSVLGDFSLLSGKMKKKGSIILACGGGQCSNNAAEEGSVTGPLKKLMTSSFFESEPDDDEIEALKLYAMALSKDNPEEAEEILNKERQHWVAGEADDKLLLALVELLVYREEYDRASEKIEELRGIVKGDIEAGISTKWTKFYLLKAIVESVNEARQKVEEEEEEEEEELEEYELEIEEVGDDTNKPKEELWLIYSRKVKERNHLRSFRR